MNFCLLSSIVAIAACAVLAACTPKTRPAASSMPERGLQQPQLEPQPQLPQRQVDSSEPPDAASGGPTDCHIHLDPSKAGHDGEAVAKLIREAGFAHACVLSPGYQAPKACAAHPCEGQRAWTREANDWTLAQTASHSSLLAFCGAPLAYEWSAEEVKRCVEAGGRGVKLHMGRGAMTLSSPAIAANLRAVLEVAASVRVPVLMHVKFEAPEVMALYKVVRAVPSVRLVVAHQLGPMMPLLMQAPDNVWTEISGLLMIDAEQRAAIVPLWRAFGMHRILLGSDWPLFEPGKYRDVLKAMPLTADERTKLQSGNFARLFER